MTIDYSYNLYELQSHEVLYESVPPSILSIVITYILHGAHARNGANVIGDGVQRGSSQVLFLCFVALILCVHASKAEIESRYNHNLIIWKYKDKCVQFNVCICKHF